MRPAPDTGTGRATAIQAAAGGATHPTTTTTRGDLMSATHHHDERTDTLRALLAERYGPYADTARERAPSPAQVLHLDRARRRPERREAA